MLAPSQQDFESRLSEYLEQQDEYLEFSMLFNSLHPIVGLGNVLMYDTDALRSKRVLAAVVEFCGFPPSGLPTVLHTVNSMRAERKSWKLRPYSGFTNSLKARYPFHERRLVFRVLKVFGAMLDTGFRVPRPDPGMIRLSSTLTRRVRARFGETNRDLRELEEEHPGQIFLAESNWGD